MDALTALGLAANVIQFVDFAASILSKGNTIRKSADGALKENTQLRSISSRMQTLTADLERSIHNPFTQNDQALKAICSSCFEIATELNLKLSTLTARGGISRFKSYRQALKSV